MSDPVVAKKFVEGEKSKPETDPGMTTDDWWNFTFQLKGELRLVENHGDKKDEEDKKADENKDKDKNPVMISRTRRKSTRERD